ncbi:MAG TPA: hypothetical protein VJ836_01490 [Candidatus Saccharimonadales bacterium]|nr:hypothetical protein [Candidatus Saccharimonadales bacterium]
MHPHAVSPELLAAMSHLAEDRFAMSQTGVTPGQESIEHLAAHAIDVYVHSQGCLPRRRPPRDILWRLAILARQQAEREEKL